MHLGSTTSNHALTEMNLLRLCGRILKQVGKTSNVMQGKLNKQGHSFTKFLGVSEVVLRDFFVCDVFLFVNSRFPMVCCPVNCPAEVHFIGGGSNSITSLQKLAGTSLTLKQLTGFLLPLNYP